MNHKPRFTLLPIALATLAASSTVFANDVFLTCSRNNPTDRDEEVWAFNEAEGWIKRYLPNQNELVDQFDCSGHGVSCAFSANSNEIRYEATYAEGSSSGFVGISRMALSRRTGAFTLHHDGTNDYGRLNDTMFSRTCRPTSDPREAPALF